MTNTDNIQIVKDLPNKKVTITRHFDADLELVWHAWTDSEMLDMWWAPKPWSAQTKSLDFREGGHWLYAMVGPGGEKNWCMVDFLTIDHHKSFTAKDSFCDENGEPTHELPSMNWKNTFYEKDGKATVVSEIVFASEKDLETIFEMGFEAGFTSALTNLDEYFAAILPR